MTTNRHAFHERGGTVRAASFLVLFVLAGGCRQEMYNQPRLEPLEQSDFFPRGMSARPEIPGTVARGHLELDDHLYRGRVNRALAEAFPFEIETETLERGQRQFGVFCSPCHGSSGYGNGAIVRRGFPAPPSFHSELMRSKPVGHYFNVITNGFGVMYDYAARVSPRDRWAIIAYIRALQLSQRATLDDVPVEERQRLEDQ